MNFLNNIGKFLKNLTIYTIKKIYSFFIYILLTIFILGGIASCSLLYIQSSDNVAKNYDTLLLKDISIPSEDKFINSIQYIDGKSNTFSDLLIALNKVSEDDKIKNILIYSDSFILSPAQIEEVEPIFKKIKEAGKKVYAYSENLDRQNYDVSLLADEIIIPKYSTAQVTLNGYSVNSGYYKNLFDKFGFKMEVIHIGTHKSYGENYYRDSMSQEQKDTITRIYDKRLNDFVEKVSTSRKIDKNTFINKLLNGEYVFLSPEKSRDLSLVDSLKDFDTLKEELNISDNNSIDIQEYIKTIVPQFTSPNKIAVIYLDGDIESTTSYTNPNITSEAFKDKLDEALSYPGVAGLVIRINSGGGSALEAKKIYDMLAKVDIPVYISIGNVAASGGYYIASIGNKIFADKNSITGSIGVVSVLPKLIGTYNKLGINIDGVQKGKYVDILSSNHEMTEEERELYRNSMLEVYNEFKNDVLVKRTNLNQDSLEAIAQGQIWLGTEALKNGLIDQIGGLYDTIDALQKELKLDHNYNIINIYSVQKYDSLLDHLMDYIPLNLSKKQKINFDYVEDKLNFLLRQDGKLMYYSPEIEIYTK